jgi:hypothetical protein
MFFGRIDSLISTKGKGKKIAKMMVCAGSRGLEKGFSKGRVKKNTHSPS